MQGSSELPSSEKRKGLPLPKSTSPTGEYYLGCNVAVCSKREFLVLPLSAASIISTLNTSDWMFFLLAEACGVPWEPSSAQLKAQDLTPFLSKMEHIVGLGTEKLEEMWEQMDNFGWNF